MRSLASCLPGVLAEMAADEEASLLFLKELWPQIVGIDISRQALPFRLENQTLVLVVENEAWRSQLESLNPRLTEKINQFWGRTLVKKIVLRSHLNTSGPE